MYDIYVNDNGSCKCRGMLQDGYEYWDSPSLDEAVKSMKLFAEYGNHNKKLKKKHIGIWKKKQVIQEVWEKFDE